MGATKRSRLIVVGASCLLVLGTAACEEAGSPAAPDADVRAVDAVAAVEAPGRLFILNDGGLTRQYPQSPCQGGTPHRDFAFWLGEWEVFNPAGNIAGTNFVRPLLDGCLVEENWTGAGGFQGRSMNAYDAASGTWSQYWIDQGATHLRLEGGLVDGNMVLQGPRAFTPTLPVIDRITWTPEPDGDVRQFWDLSVDDGETFPFVIFNGTYVSTPGVQPAPPLPSDVCAGPDYRRLDFLVGDWRVETSQGESVGTAEGQVDLQGCLIELDLATHQGYEAQSFFGWDPSTGNWYRNYVDSEGVRLRMSGNVEDSGVVLEGTRPLAGAGQQMSVRVTIEPEETDRVVERWEVSTNGGASWKRGTTVVLERVP